MTGSGSGPKSGADRPVRHAVALAIRRPDGGSAILLVRRPPDDADLPDVWGLPAARVYPGATPEQAALRIGPEKLGTRIRLGRELAAGHVDRAAYRLDMRVFEAELAGGEPVVPQPASGVTQYTAWRWGLADELRPAAERGSLCASLFLASGGLWAESGG